jgi:hypothetical protein
MIAETTMPDLSGIITQETQDGRLIVRFLVSAMNGDLLEFQPCHRLDAARLLVKLGFEQAQGIINSAAAQRAAKRNSQRESRSANNRIRSELAQIALEETDNGRTTVRFLVQVMQGELDDFKPCHRLSAAKELLHRGFDYTPDDEDIEDEAEAEPAPDPVEEERRRRREEAVEFSLHGPPYYRMSSYPCSCEDRLHDCKGNVLIGEAREKAATLAPAKGTFIHDSDELDAYIARYTEYLTRLNPHKTIDFNAFRWRRDNHDP